AANAIPGATRAATTAALKAARLKITFSIFIAPDFMDLAFFFRQLASGLPLGIGIAIKTPKGKKSCLGYLQTRMSWHICSWQS
ncbi:hypothetical protein, partial [Aeromonas veronii]|uniref:hypothetical protein n=1 Tax=Aeromonas veronii TaxID=654 RepID=UPI003BA39FD7